MTNRTLFRLGAAFAGGAFVGGMFYGLHGAMIGSVVAVIVFMFTRGAPE